MVTKYRDEIVFEMTNAWKSMVLAVCLLFIAACDVEKQQPTKATNEDARETPSVQTIARGNEYAAHQATTPDNDDKVDLMIDEIGGTYTDSWSGRREDNRDISAEDRAAGSSILVTLYRDGKSGDFQVDMVINCKARKYTYQNAIEFGSMEVAQSEIEDAIPAELPAKVIKTFCR